MPQTPSLPPHILDGPALKAPPGEVYDFVNPWNLNNVAQLSNALCLIVATFAVMMRAFVKLFVQKKLEIEDCKQPTIIPELSELTKT
jgi:hypothetical protein